jgi:RNA polymerase sigma-70 factor (ECF subfamily)
MIAASCRSLSAMESEADAIARALRRREPDFLHALIVQYQHRLLRYLVHLSGSRDLAMDLFQETWVRVLERGHHYDGRSAFSTWLYTLARNLTIDYLRRKNPLSLEGLLQDGEQTIVEATDDRPSAWELVAQGQQGELINAALADLPTQYREAIVLRFMDGLPLDEIAAVAAVPLSTVKSRLYRGMDLLTKRLGTRGHEQ